MLRVARALLRARLRERRRRQKDSVEPWFSLPLLDPSGREIKGWRLNGKRDAIKHFAADKRTKTVEHKTTSWDIGIGADYWAGVAMSTQVSIYIDSAQRLGEDVDRVCYDVSRKPGAKPLLATPEDKRKMTKGKGCKLCGGRAGGKLGVAKGTGLVMKQITKAGNKFDVEATCEACKGTGWDEEPALYKGQRARSTKTSSRSRCDLADEIASEADAYFARAGLTTRTRDQLLESRHDLYIAAGMIGASMTMGDGIYARQHRDARSSSMLRPQHRCVYEPVRQEMRLHRRVHRRRGSVVVAAVQNQEARVEDDASVAAGCHAMTELDKKADAVLAAILEMRKKIAEVTQTIPKTTTVELESAAWYPLVESFSRRTMITWTGATPIDVFTLVHFDIDIKKSNR